jgi:hypothetical protein
MTTQETKRNDAIPIRKYTTIHVGSYESVFILGTETLIDTRMGSTVTRAVLKLARARDNINRFCL